MSASKKSKYLNLGIYDKEDSVSFLGTENGNMEIIDNYAETTDARLDSAEDGVTQNANELNSLNEYVNIFRGIAEQADKDINEKIKRLENYYDNFSTQTNNKFTRIENMFPWVVRITKDNVDDLTSDKNYSHLKLNIPDFNETDFKENHRPIILLLDSVSGTHKDFSVISINNRADFYYMCYWRYNTFIPERGVIMLMYSPGAVLKTNILVPGDATETQHGYMSADDKKALDDLIKSNPFTGTPISITNNTDINSIKTSGLYYGIGTNTYPNVYAPTKKYTFFMLVFAMGAHINQSIYIVSTDYANRVVNRSSYDTGATWTNWNDDIRLHTDNRTLINELREQVNGTELTDEDLNDITTNGIYYADTDNTVVNKPSAVTKFFMIVTTKETSTVQLIFDVGTSTFVMRSTNNGTNWRVYNYTSAIEGRVSSTPTKLTNEDLNSITKTGFYYADTGNTVSNKPMSNIDGFLMYVISNPGTQTSQIIIPTDGSLHNYLIMRCGYEENWVYINLTDSAMHAISKISYNLTNQDLNTILNNGLYYATSGNTVQHKPSNVDSFTMLVNGRDNFRTQLILVTSGSSKGHIIFRYTLDGTTWVTSDLRSLINNNSNSITKKASYMINQLRLDGEYHEWNISSKFDLTKGVNITVTPQISPLIENNVVLTSLGNSVVMPESTLHSYQKSNVIINDGTAVERDLFSVSCRGGATQVSHYATDFVYNVGAPYIIKYYLYYKIDVKSNANHILEFSGDVPEVYYTAVNLSTNKVVANREKIDYTDTDLNFTYIVQIAQ